MKKITSLLIIAFVVALTASLVFAVDWTLTPSFVDHKGNYVKWKLVCTSNGSALSATDILALSTMPGPLLKSIQGGTLMIMKISPGAGAVIPNTTINVTLADDESDTIWSTTGASKDAISWHALHTTIGAWPPITGNLYLAINDIGDSGDQVTLYFITWIE